MGELTLSGVSKSFGAQQVLHEVDLSVADGEFVVIVGPSGCGKSTLLRIVAGLETQTRGTVSIGGRDVSHVPPARRGIAMVFQSYALYPHLTVEGNMTLGLRQARTPRAVIAERVAEAARILALGPFLKRRPAQLSGGQRQRVAIGRAITRHPAVFLFDEPLSNLDAALRNQVRVEIADLHRRLGATMLYVTHDQVEAMTLADRIVVMQAGAVQQVGTPAELYRRPANRFVAGFLGSPAINLLPGQAGPAGVELPGIGTLAHAAAAAGPVTVGIRPADLELSRDAAPDAWAGTVVGKEYLGSVGFVRVRLADGAVVVAETDPDADWALDQPAHARPRAGAPLLFGPDGRRI